MTITNPKLGNGFVTKNADSTLDQEHYFTGYRKHTVLSVRFVSGTCDGVVPFGGANYVSSSDDGVVTFFNGNGNSYEMSGTLWTEENVKIEQETQFLDDYFVPGAADVTTKLLATISCEVSNSFFGYTPETANPFFGEISMRYFDGYNHSPTGFDLDENFILVEDLDDGWKKIEVAFEQVSGSRSTSFPLNLKKSGLNALYITLQFADYGGSPVQTCSFREFRVDFREPLTDEGVKYFRDLDNQNINFQFLNPSVFGKVE